MNCKKVLLSNESEINWIYFNFRRCSDNYFESQYGIAPLGQREINYLDGTLVSAFETGYQIDPDGFYGNITPVPTPAISPSSTPSVTPTPTPTTTVTPSPSPSAFSCNNISNIWAWFKTDFGLTSFDNGNYLQVDDWLDSSPNFNQLIPVQPNFPEVAVDTVGTLSTNVVKKSSFNIASMATSANFPDTSTSGVSIFAVVKMDSISFFGGDVLIKADNGIQIGNLPSPNRITGRVGTNTPTTLDGVYTLGTYITVRLLSDSTTQSLSFNNVEVDSSSDVNNVHLGNNKFRILANISSQAIDASIAEIVVYTRALDGTEISQVENYLKNKYNHY
jgi:hypothetical protein